MTPALSSLGQAQTGERLSTPMRPVALDQAHVFIVVAAYNEAACVGDLVRELREHYPNIVVVDDGSYDETAELAIEAGACVLTHLINRGQGAALQTGITYALGRGADYIVTLDVDGQYDVMDIASLLAPIVEGKVHATLGSRFAPGQKLPPARRAARMFARWLSRLSAGARPSDVHNGLRAFSRHAAQLMDLKLDRMAHGSETVSQVAAAGLPYLEVPVRVRGDGEYALRRGQSSGAALRVAIQYLLARFMR